VANTQNDIDKYISSFPNETQAVMKKIRAVIMQAAPHAQECMSYGMPAYKANDLVLVYFAAYKNHIGFYATPTGHKKFEAALSQYKQGKGSVQFPLNKPMPFTLISKIVKYRLKENQVKQKEKLKKICKKGHVFYKSSNCLTCPKCEAANKSKNGFLTLLSAPAQRALKESGITSVKKLSQYSEKEILQLHGIGKSSIPILKAALKDLQLRFKLA
jgi:uncharacterized protein YdhG (YjbR/CyaY superfamily)